MASTGAMLGFGVLRTGGSMLVAAGSQAAGSSGLVGVAPSAETVGVPRNASSDCPVSVPGVPQLICSRIKLATTTVNDRRCIYDSLVPFWTPSPNLPDGNHSLYSPRCPHPDLLRYLNHVLCIFQGAERIFHRDLIHMRASHSAKPEHFLLWIGRSDVITHGTFGEHQVARGRCLLNVLDHR